MYNGSNTAKGIRTTLKLAPGGSARNSLTTEDSEISLWMLQEFSANLILISKSATSVCKRQEGWVFLSFEGLVEDEEATCLLKKRAKG